MVFWKENNPSERCDCAFSAAMPLPSASEDRPSLFAARVVPDPPVQSTVPITLPRVPAWDQVKSKADTKQEVLRQTGSSVGYETLQQLQAHPLPDLRFLLRDEEEIRKLYCR